MWRPPSVASLQIKRVGGEDSASFSNFDSFRHDESGGDGAVFETKKPSIKVSELRNALKQSSRLIERSKHGRSSLPSPETRTTRQNVRTFMATAQRPSSSPPSSHAKGALMTVSYTHLTLPTIYSV